MVYFVEPFFRPFEVLTSDPFYPHRRRWSGRRVPRRCPTGTDFIDHFATFAIDVFDDDNICPRKVQLLERSKDVQPRKDFSAQLNLKGFDPDNDVKIEVDPKSRCVTLRAEKEVKKEGLYESRNMRRSFYVPRGYDLDSIRASVSKSLKVLSLEAPLVNGPKAVDKENSKELAEKKDVTNIEIKVADSLESNKEESEVVVEEPEPSMNEREAADKRSDEEKDQSSAEVTEDAEGQAREPEETNRGSPHRFEVDFSGFSPDDAHVEVDDSKGLVRLHAERECVGDDNVRERRTLHREYPFDPAKFDLSSLVAKVEGEGNTLILECLPRKEEKARDIPVVTLQ